MLSVPAARPLCRLRPLGILARPLCRLQPLGILARPLCRVRRWSSSYSHVSARVLEDAERSSSGLPGPSLPALLELTKVLPPQPVSILMLRAAARDQSSENRLRQAQFILRELIARRAHILTLLHEIERSKQQRWVVVRPAVHELAQIFWGRLKRLLATPEPETEDQRARFVEDCIVANQDIAKLTIPAETHWTLVGLDALQKEHGPDWWKSDPEARVTIDRQLDAIFLARIGLRFLLEHYLACEEQREGFTGILETNCSPVQVCHEVAAETEAQLLAEFGAHPPIEVVGDASKTFTYVPKHIRKVVGTLLKNSGVATLRHQHLMKQRTGGDVGAPIAPVRCIVAVSDETVQIKLADEAGGIRRSSLINVWSYRSLESSWWRPVDGISLPLARLYCQYFGGSISMIPMEGYGTDCYVTLNRLAHANSEQIIPVPATHISDGGGLLDVRPIPQPLADH